MHECSLKSNLRISSIKFTKRIEYTLAKDLIIKVAKIVPFGHLEEDFTLVFFPYIAPLDSYFTLQLTSKTSSSSAITATKSTPFGTSKIKTPLGGKDLGQKYGH